MLSTNTSAIQSRAGVFVYCLFTFTASVLQKTRKGKSRQRYDAVLSSLNTVRRTRFRMERANCTPLWELFTQGRAGDMYLQAAALNIWTLHSGVDGHKDTAIQSRWMCDNLSNWGAACQACTLLVVGQPYLPQDSQSRDSLLASDTSVRSRGVVF